MRSFCQIVCFVLDVTQDHTPNMKLTVEKIIQIMGKERNYGETIDSNYYKPF